jgi:hypothetical protein
VRALAAAIGLQAVSFFALAPAVRALPPPQAPKGNPTTSPTPLASGAQLPYGSALLFVLDDRISSAKTSAGTTIRMHLKEPLVVNGVTLAPAGAPGTLSVVMTRRAASGDLDGAVAIHLDPLALPGRPQKLPIRAFHEYLTIEMTAGQTSTRATTDAIADVFVPYHVIYHAFRKGHEMVVPAGSTLRAETNATVEVRNARDVVIAPPPPFVSNYDTPHSDLTPLPLYTAVPMLTPSPRAKHTPSPSPLPTTVPSHAPSPRAVLVPTPWPT